MVLEQCKLTMEFNSNIDLNNARYDATANKYDMKRNNLLIKWNTNAGVFTVFSTVPAKIVSAMAKTQPWLLVSDWIMTPFRQTIVTFPAV